MVTDELAKENIATNVIALLEKRGLSKVDLAEKSGENKMYISRVCSGKMMSSAAALARIAEALGTTSEALMEFHKNS